jgi:hypothetical protein
VCYIKKLTINKNKSPFTTQFLKDQSTTNKFYKFREICVEQMRHDSSGQL